MSPHCQFQGLYFGLGYGLGSLIGGSVAQRHGFQAMYIVGACMVAGGWAVSRLGRWLARSSGSSSGGRGGGKGGGGSGGHYLPVSTAERELPG